MLCNFKEKKDYLCIIIILLLLLLLLLLDYHYYYYSKFASYTSSFKAQGL